MPPRRPPLGGSGNPNTDIRQERRPARAGKGAPPPPLEDDRDDEAPGGRSSSRGNYRTGPEYPAADEESLPSDDEAPDLGDRDIYGEDDPLPDELGESGEGSAREAAEDNPDATRAGPPRKIVVIAGPDKGKVKRFTGARLVVGRTSSCHVHLSDSSVSRRHLEMVQGANGVLLRDLVSGNGTKVNGERVTERVLKHEDVIEIGQTKFQYIDEAEAIRLMREEAEKREEEEKRKKEEEEQRKKAEEEAAAAKAKDAEGGEAKEGESAEQAESAESAPPEVGGTPMQQVRRAFRGLNLTQKVGLGIAGGAVLFVMFLIIPALFRPSPPPPPPQKQVLATKKLEQAQLAYKQERYQEAVDLAAAAERLWPGIDADGTGARAQNELAALKVLGDARAALEQQNFEEARKALAQMPEASARSAEEKKKLEAELAQQEGEYLTSTIEKALEALEVDAARQAINQLPEDKRKAYQPRLQEAERMARKHAEELAKESARDRKLREQQERQARQAKLDAAFSAVGRKLNGGDFERAVLECDRVIDSNPDAEARRRAVDLKRLIPAFATAWEDGERKYQNRALESAIRPLRKARDLYMQIHLLGALEARLNDELVEALDAGGKAAMLRNDVASAATYYRDAALISPGDDTAKAGLERIAQRAEDLYLEAYMIRDRDPKESIAKLKLVLEVAPKGSAAYEKAKAQLAARQP